MSSDDSRFVACIHGGITAVVRAFIRNEAVVGIDVWKTGIDDTGPHRYVGTAWISRHRWSLRKTLANLQARVPAAVQMAKGREAAAHEYSRPAAGLEYPGNNSFQKKPGFSPILRLRQLGLFLADLFTRALKRFLLVEQWAIRLYNMKTKRTTDLIPPPDRVWADPFLIQWRDEIWLFFEDRRRRGNGTLRCARLSDDGTTGPDEEVLRRPYHLSYPQVFEHDHQLFMIPETHQDHGVDLYRCTSFPNEWKLVGRLIDGVDLVDATILQNDGSWYLFASGSSSGTGGLNSELFIYVSERLYGSPWRAHPCNPVVIDPRCCRGAGAIFRRNGQLFRPVQNCAGGYGLSVMLREITSLSPDAFEEENSEEFLPDRRRKELALHTWNRLRDWVVTDRKQYRLSIRIRKG